MTSPAKVYFHIGFTKVASTYFQRVIFPRLNDVTFHKKHQFKKYPVIASQISGGKHLFSSEKDRRIVEVAKDIVQYFPDAGFIIFLRRQDEWLLSRYKYGIRKHGNTSFTAFFDLQNNTGLWKKETLIYKKVITEIEKLSGKKPLVLLYDDLKKDPQTFISRVEEYMETSVKKPLKKQPVNIAFNEKQLIILRKWNKILKYREDVSRIKFLRIIYQKIMGLLLHTIAFIGRFIPWSLIKTKSLLTDKEKQTLIEIQEFYADDWDFCIRYSSKFSSK